MELSFVYSGNETVGAMVVSRLEAAGCTRTDDVAHAEAIITRNQADFDRSTIPVYDCAEFFAHLKNVHGLVYEEIDW